MGVVIKEVDFHMKLSAHPSIISSSKHAVSYSTGAFIYLLVSNIKIAQWKG